MYRSLSIHIYICIERERDVLAVIISCISAPSTIIIVIIIIIIICIIITGRSRSSRGAACARSPRASTTA